MRPILTSQRPDVAYIAFNFLKGLLHYLGLEVSMQKLVSPSTSVVCIGINIDVTTNTLSITQTKLIAIYQACIHWKSKTVATKKQLQSLLGKLLYIGRCVRPARMFLNRMLQVLRTNHNRSHFKLTPMFFRDLVWFTKYLLNFNGTVLYALHPKPLHLFMDASLQGTGAVLGNKFMQQLYQTFTNLTCLLFISRC